VESLVTLLGSGSCQAQADCWRAGAGVGWVAGLALAGGLFLWWRARSRHLASAREAAAARAAEEAAHRRARADLLGLEQGLAAALAGIGAGVIATDREGLVTRLNGIAEQVTGWTQAEAQGQPIGTVLVRNGGVLGYSSRHPVDAMLEPGGDPRTAGQVVVVARDGRRTPVELHAARTGGGDAGGQGMVVVFRDQSALIQAGAESNRLAAIVESSSDAIIGKTLDGRITSWNGGAQALFGYTADEAIGQPVQMLIPPEREAEEMAILARLARGAVVPAFDTVRRARDGSLREVSVTISPIRDARGHIVGASKIARDLAGQRRAAAVQRDSDSLLRTLHLHFIVSITDPAGRIVDVNERFCRISGYGRDELIGHTHRVINSGVQDREFWSAMWSTITSGQAWHGEICNRAKDGSLYWVDSVIAPFVGADGRMEKFVSIRTDITAAKRAEGARLDALRLEAENRQILEATRLKSQFLANMSHELRTPLNAIIGFAELMHAGAVRPESPKHHQYLGHIATSGRHLLQLINDVLDLSKVEAGRFEFFPEPIDLPLLIHGAIDILHTGIERKHLQLIVEIDATLTDLVLDPARLKQVLYNYLSNAIKFTPEGGRIAVRARAEGARQFRLEVEDSGIGIAEADLPRLYVEFQQLDAGYTKQHQGTGLGLALTRRLVQAQGGSVGVRSVPGLGSVFHVVLDRVPGAVAPPDEPEAQGRTDTAGAPPGHRVLVIEDDRDQLAHLVQALTAAGFVVDAASSGAQAVRWAVGRNYAAITLDLMLPDQRGLDVLASIRQQGASRDAPVRGMTMPANGGAAATFAIADVLCKPIRTGEIVAAMARFRLQGSRRPNVMVVDDEPVALDLMRATLAGMGIEAVCLQDGREALRDIALHQPDALILDLMMPGFDGFDVLEGLRGLPLWQHIPVYIWTSMILTEEEYARLARSARAIVSKGGGTLAAVLESLSHRRPVAPPLPERSDP